jgi:hypothetical protein
VRRSARRELHDPSVADGSYAGYKAVTLRPAEGLCGVVHVLAIAGSNGLTYFKMRSTMQQVEFYARQGLLSARTHLDKQVATLLTIPFDLGAHAWWRLRQQNGVTYWDVSSDGVSYSLLASTSFVTDPMLQFEVGAGSFGTSSNAGTAAFDEALLTGP